MEGNPNFSLVRRTPGDLEQTRPGAKRIVAGMVGEALELAGKHLAAKERPQFRIGDTELCEPDYRQILCWAGALELPPEEVLARLHVEESESAGEPIWGANFGQSVVVEGKLRKIRWSFDRLPLTDFQWEPGLQITHAGFYRSEPQIQRLSLVLPTLTHLFCRHLCLAELDLTQVPLLTTLECGGDNSGGNTLTKLNLTPVPRLTSLTCCGTELTELNLTPVPRLTELFCWANQLTGLDLTPVPQLKKLYCGMNPLTELDLTPVPRLTTLGFARGPLTELDLTPVPRLTTLDCWESQLTALDLTPVPQLTALYCWGSQLTGLDLSSVPLLETLDCSHNSIGALDVRHLRHLVELDYDRDTTVLLQRPDQHF